MENNKCKLKGITIDINEIEKAERKVKKDIKPSEIEIAVNIAMNRQAHIIEKRLYKGISKQITYLSDKIDELIELIKSK